MASSQTGVKVRATTSADGLHPHGSRPSELVQAVGDALRQYSPGRDGPSSDELRSYGLLMGIYLGLGSLGAWAIRRRRGSVGRFSAFELATYALATQHLSRLVSKDSVTAVLRAPFTRFDEAAGEGEVNEEVRGRGLPHATGELLTCPFCLAQWIATALVTGRALFPDFTNAVVSLSAVARTSDYLQLLYGLLREHQDS